MAQERAKARHRRHSSEAHAQLRQLEEKLKQPLPKPESSAKFCVGCCAAKVLSDLLLLHAVIKTDAHTHDADAVAHGPCCCLVLRAGVHWLPSLCAVLVLLVVSVSLVCTFLLSLSLALSLYKH